MARLAGAELELAEIGSSPLRQPPVAAGGERAGFTDTGAMRAVGRMPPGRRDGYKVYVGRAED